ncbi:oxidoreductase [Vallitalea sediminicola]
MLRLQQVKFGLDHNENDIYRKIRNELRINEDTEFSYTIVKKSIDARKKNDIKIVYTFDINIDNEDKLLEKKGNRSLSYVANKKYEFPNRNTNLSDRPIIVGSGPAGLFCALVLAENGYKPIVLERGQDMDNRVKDVEQFTMTNELSTKSNVQFGEGGAGTFSDGKLNTLVKDKFLRNRKVLEEFVEGGAPEEILYYNKPHIGTDYLRKVVINIRKKIIDLGGAVRFNSQVTSLLVDDGHISGVIVNNDQKIDSSNVILAVGHSARDTFSMLKEKNILIEKKPFAIGLRIEHPQDLINKSQYGSSYKHKNLPVADYKLTHHCKNGRGVYSFCMCPGGYVVNASSEESRVVTNGMSNYLRDADNANSALLVNVTPEDFPEEDVLAGVAFQRKWEELAYVAGGSNYNIPVQQSLDFMNNKISTSIGDVHPSLENKATLSNLNDCLPNYVCDAIKEGIVVFDRKIRGFARKDAILSGVETRSSSPIRIIRDKDYESNIKGLYPCGEGAGYAGGIMSAAMDGIKVAEAVTNSGVK